MAAEPEPELGGGVVVPCKLLAVFVVRFHVTKGNTLEWVYPKEGGYDLDGVEFKAMPSGLHLIKQDRVYLKQGGHFGVACFHNMPTDDKTQRNARMCSVGCIMSKREGLYEIADALMDEAKQQNQDAEEARLEYGRLQAIYDAHTNTVDMDSVRVNPLAPDSFASFVRFMGADLFLLWKAMMLRKRILFYSPVPIEQGCMRVRWIAETMNAEGKQFDDTNLLFYVNVFDIDHLGSMTSYVACTSESIFEEKGKLWDVYVNNQNILLSDECKLELCTTPVDRHRLGHLAEPGFAKAADSEVKLCAYFSRLNGELWGALSSMCTMPEQAGGDMQVGLSAPYSKLKRSEIEQKLGLHAKDANFVEAVSALLEHALEVERGALDSLPCFA